MFTIFLVNIVYERNIWEYLIFYNYFRLCEIENGKILGNDSVFQDGHKVDIGLKLEKVVGITNKALQGITSSTYIYSIFIMIAFSFQMLSYTLSNAIHTTIYVIMVAKVAKKVLLFKEKIPYGVIGGVSW